MADLCAAHALCMNSDLSLYSMPPICDSIFHSFASLSLQHFGLVENELAQLLECLLYIVVDDDLVVDTIDLGVLELGLGLCKTL